VKVGSGKWKKVKPMRHPSFEEWQLWQRNVTKPLLLLRQNAKPDHQLSWFTLIAQADSFVDLD
jgi:hypothetical protein